jgi:nitrogen regulation protein NR(I)
MRKHILIVDDEPSIRKVLGAHLRRDGYDVTVAASGVEAIETLQEEGADLVITDLRMPGMDGLELLRWVKQSYPGLPVIMLTAHGTVDSAVEALKRGAQDYLTKPFDQDELRLVILKALAQEEKSRRSLKSDEAPRDAIVGDTPTMRAVFALVDKVASSPSTVLITGESGTGKELVARAIHHASARREAPFVTLNCGAIPENLFESELFGHERGAFTGAVTSKPGRFEIADGGTLFLDEIAELPKDLQVKLLRVLQDQTFERVGGLKTIKVDVRLVAATNSDLRQAVTSGAFREDLYYRLNVVPVALPPLRERVDDIPLLVHHFLQKFNRRLDKHVQGITPEALAALKSAPWPGNIRELENLVERAVLLSDGGSLDVHDFPGVLDGGAAVPVDEASDELGLKEYVRVHTARLERARIKKALQQEEGNVTRASRLLGISRKSLQTKMKEYGLREE